ncbi:hypothetical protein C1C97_006605 [Kocuria tytonis]|uniref:Uncharacterized protein n=1 Tax=Kocuria tytonis TaxID=2054280 RepID=A0A495A6K0_9MICC|nr:hypothetical protein C1C97_006605 [Kocuria tytonis]
MGPRTSRGWPRVENYIAWVTILLVGISITGSDLRFGAFVLGHSLWLGISISALGLGGLVVRVRRDVRASRQAPAD